MNQFASFWHGPPLAPFEAACLHSFVEAGHEVTLYGYEPVGNLPAGVRRGDAAKIADRAKMDAFRIGGKPSVSHFSDYFRYRMFARTEHTWIDTDVLLLRSWEQPPQRNLLALETPTSLCNAVMRVASDEPWLPELIERAEALTAGPMRWGETGPRLLTKIVGTQALMAQAAPPAQFFPIHWDDFWKVFLPEHADECRALCREAHTLHLWNNIVERLGYWKEFLPPADSYLHDLFVEHGGAPYFRGVFPLRNMRQLVENWRSRQTGDQLGIRGVVRQLVPSLQRTLRHYKG
jgi:Alpha 1,4-glycosyltransferase conserved region